MSFIGTSRYPANSPELPWYGAIPIGHAPPAQLVRLPQIRRSPYPDWGGPPGNSPFWDGDTGYVPRQLPKRQQPRREGRDRGSSFWDTIFDWGPDDWISGGTPSPKQEQRVVPTRRSGGGRRRSLRTRIRREVARDERRGIGEVKRWCHGVMHWSYDQDRSTAGEGRVNAGITAKCSTDIGEEAFRLHVLEVWGAYHILGQENAIVQPGVARSGLFIKGNPGMNWDDPQIQPYAFPLTHDATNIRHRGTQRMVFPIIDQTLGGVSVYFSNAIASRAKPNVLMGPDVSGSAQTVTPGWAWNFEYYSPYVRGTATHEFGIYWRALLSGWVSMTEPFAIEKYGGSI